MTHSDNNPIETFKRERLENASAYQKDAAFKDSSLDWMIHAFRKQYMHNFTWTGRPIIQLPADMIALQEIIWTVRPDLIIETGIAHGGSLMLSASMLALLDYCDALEQKKMLDPQNPSRRVLAIDIDIRAHNRTAIESHPLSNRIDMIQGSSVAENIVKQVRDISSRYKNVLVCLDSNHTHDHVIQELEHYAPLVSKGSYCVAFDTVIEDLPNDMFPDRPWEHGDNSKTAVYAYLETLKSGSKKGSDGKPLNFEIDYSIQNKLLLSAMPDGLLKRV